MRGLTMKEQNMLHYIKGRLSMISSPVIRMQIILQYSQLVDMFTLGDTCTEHEQELLTQVDELQSELLELKGELGTEDEENA